jgi:hypothetical protein
MAMADVMARPTEQSTGVQCLERDWQVIFNEEFSCPDASAVESRSPGGLDLSVWAFDVGMRDMSDPSNPGPEQWGNGEPQYYTDRCGDDASR